MIERMEPAAPDSAAEFTALAAAWLATHRSGHTQAAYAADLAWFAEWCAQTGHSPMHVTQADVEQHRADCEAAGSGAATVRRRLAALSSFFEYSTAVQHRAQNPAADVERPHTTATSTTAELDEHEADELGEAALDLGPKAVVLVSLLMEAGLKLGEAVDADADDFVTPPPTLTVMRRGRPQAVPLAPSTADAVRSYTSGRASGPLLLGDSPTRKPGRLTRAGADHILKRVAQHAGITKVVSANTLRRFYATNAYANGAHIDEIRAHLGHDDRRTTERLLLPEHRKSRHQQKRRT